MDKFKNDFKSFIKTVFGKGTVTGQGKDIQVVCPICKSIKQEGYNNRKFSICLDEEKLGLTNCWVCGYSARNLTHILKKFFPQFVKQYKENFLRDDGRKSRLKDREQEEEFEPVTLPSDFILLATVGKTKNAYIREALNYLKTRRADSPEDLWYWKFGISKAKNLFNRIIIPSFDEEGNLNYFSARLMEDDSDRTKYFNPRAEREEIVFNEINIDWKKELTIVEGPFDLIKSNPNSTPLLGSDLSSNYKLFYKIVENKTPTVLALDPEAKEKQMVIARRLFEFDVPVKVFSLRGKKDIGEFGNRKEFETLLKSGDSTRTFTMDYHLKEKISSINTKKW